MALLAGQPAAAQRRGSGAAKVVTAPAKSGVLAPHAEFRGTVFFKEVSHVATEVNGKVTDVNFEEGDRVAEGQELVRLDDTLLRKDLEVTQFILQRYKADLEDAEVRFDRTKALVEDGLKTPQEEDELRFQARSLSRQVDATQAELERIETLIDKNSIQAPFDGIVLDRQTELGEWKSGGATVAVIAREHVFDVIVDLPENYLKWIDPGMRVRLATGGHDLEGTVATIVPRGDIATRTFPVKIRVEFDGQIYEGMAATVMLPTGAEVECILVPSDALLYPRGRSLLFTVDAGTAKEHSVTVLGHEGGFTGVSAPGLSASMAFVVKGHERLRDGQQVEVLHTKTTASDTASDEPLRK